MGLCQKWQIREQEVDKLRSKIMALEERLTSTREDNAMKTAEGSALKSTLLETRQLLARAIGDGEAMSGSMQALQEALRTKEADIHSLRTALGASSMECQRLMADNS